MITILAKIKTVSRASSRKPPFLRTSSSSFSSSTGPIVCGSRIRTRGLRESAVVAETRLRSIPASSKPSLRVRVNTWQKHLRRFHCHFLRAASARQRRRDARSLAKFERNDIGATRKHRIVKVSRLLGVRWLHFLVDVRDDLPEFSVHVARRIIRPEIKFFQFNRAKDILPAKVSRREVRCVTRFVSSRLFLKIAALRFKLATLRAIPQYVANVPFPLAREICIQ